MTRHIEEKQKKRRFAFGKNWRNFVKHVDGDRISEAENSLRAMLDVERLDGMRFLDIGSGSGLFSVAAHRLGATVVSFDFDPQSVESTKLLKKEYSTGNTEWTIREGSALDAGFLDGLGKYDIVYSWGVLHHTGTCGRPLIM